MMSRINRSIVGQTVSSEAFFIFSVLALVLTLALQLVMELLFAIVISLILATFLERIIIDLWHRSPDDIDEEFEEEREADLKSLLDTTTNCMSCMKPLESQLQCPHCGFEMTEIIQKRDN